VTKTTNQLVLFFVGMLSGAGAVVLVLLIEYLHRVGGLLP
jgi:hypothetical protein